MYTISMNKSAKNFIKHICYNLNEEQYFDKETWMETKSWRVVKPWMQYAPPPERGGVYNIFRPVWCSNPLWMGRTRGTAASDSWSVIWPAGDKEPKIPLDLRSLSLPYIRFFRNTLTLTAKDSWCVVETWMWYAPPPDGNILIRKRLWAWKGLLQSLIRLRGGNRRIGDQPKEGGFGGQGHILFQIGLWADQGRFIQEGER